MNWSMNTRQQGDVLKLIGEQNHQSEVNPDAVVKSESVSFFEHYYNNCEGWFCTVRYPNGIHEIWFVVDISYISEKSYLLQKIT